YKIFRAGTHLLGPARANANAALGGPTGHAAGNTLEEPRHGQHGSKHQAYRYGKGVKPMRYLRWLTRASHIISIVQPAKRRQSGRGIPGSTWERMSALGQKRTSDQVRIMSALP